MYKKKLFVWVLFFCLADVASAQTVVLKSNILSWMTATPNVGAEVKVGKAFTLDVAAHYNPFSFGNDRFLKHWGVQPELRYWLCKPFKGHFFGLHGGYANYNVSWGGPDRYAGDIFGVGLGYGYQWMLSKRWSVEAELGVGYARSIYDKYDCATCGSHVGSGKKNYFGPTKVAVSLIYVIK